MPFIEAPTTFYMGRRYDPERRQLTEDVVYYDSRDLVTHAMVVGMTGSGKTGLCISMLEEAIIDNIPAIIIDPKGDITNLLLTFPDLRPEDFEPWVNVDDARRAGQTVEQFAADEAQKWADGLERWGIVPDRLRVLQRIAQYTIYTPGSDAGVPVSILSSFAAPREGWVGNEEALREKIAGMVTALLALIGKTAEPIKDKEHVLISNIFEYAWQRGMDLTLEDIVLKVRQPPFERLGVVPVDEYMSERLRNRLAMELNSIIAAPSFQSWVNGQPMDMQKLLYQPNGRPRVSIFYIAHLPEAERMFIITLILENMLSWMRGLSGTTSLRALLYIDEMFGYFPPHPRNPPTKSPILRLLKQARAFGIGLILATQNPGDLDYKGLSNMGTWFIGRLTSENDKQRVISGLESMASAQENMDLRDVSRMISDIVPRVFLMRNVHDTAGPVMLHTRWAMSYLRGPLTRQQVQTLMASQRMQFATPARTHNHVAAQTAPPSPPGVPAPPPTLPGMAGGFNGGTTAAPPPPPGSTSQLMRARTIPGFVDRRPPVSASQAQYFLPVTITTQQALMEWQRDKQVRIQNIGASTLAYQPVLLAQAIIRFQDRKSGLFTARQYAFHVPDLQRAGFVRWEEFQAPPVDPAAITSEPFTPALFGELPQGLTDTARLSALRREVVDMLYNTVRLTIPYNATLNIYANPDADPSLFQTAVQQAAREQRDAEMDKVSERYGAQMERLEEQRRKKELELGSEQKELQDRRREELYTTGEALMSLWRGRTNYTLSRMSRAKRYRRQTTESLAESRVALREIDERMDRLEQEYEDALAAINDKWAKIVARVDEYVITPFKKDIHLELYGIGWIPVWHVVVDQQGIIVPAYG